MAVLEETPLASSLANGSTTVFPHLFTVPTAADLVVKGTLNGTTTTYTSGVDYTVSGLGTSSGAVTFGTAPANGTTVVRYRDTKVRRQTDYQDGGDLQADVLNADIDRQVLLLQEVVAGGKGSPTSIRFPVGEPVDPLPAPATRKGKLLGFDSVTGAWVLVTGVVGTAVQLALDLVSATGSTLVGFKRSGTSAVTRTVQEKLEELRTADDFGALGNGTGNDAQAITDADANAGLVREYKVTSYSAKYGNDNTPQGVAHNQTTGRVYNPSKHRFMHFFGAETLQHWFELFTNDATTASGYVKKLMVSGDSVTNGYGNSSYAVPANIFSVLATRRGYKNVLTINRGQDGKSMEEYINDGFLAGDLALTPDLLILGWGDNDFGQGRTVDQLLADYRTALTTIRAAKPVDDLSIIIRTPTSMNDIEFNRTQVMLERIIEGYKQLARDFQCAFVDVYSLLQNSHDGAGIWGDLDHGRMIHPLDVLQEHICGYIADLALPDDRTDWTCNGVYNFSGGLASNKRGVSDGPQTYFTGLQMNRFADSAGNANGAPYDGVSHTSKQADLAALQWITPLPGVTAGRGIAARVGYNTTWGPMLGGKVSGASLLQNGWTDASGSDQPFLYWIDFDGTLRLGGQITAGTKTDGTTLFTMPAGYISTKNQVVPVVMDVGVARLLFQNDGQVRLYGGSGGGAYLSLSGVVVLP